MNAGPDVERRISTWLAEEVPTRAPDRILPAAFERTRHAHQRRLGVAWRTITMNRTWQLATAAVVGILLIAAGAVWIGGSNGIGGPAGPPPSPTPTPTPSPFPSSGAVAPGTYRITFPGVPAVIVTLPAGWTNGGAGGPTKNDSTPLLVSLSPWIVSNIYADPCKWDGQLDPRVGPSVDDLANALAKQPSRNGTTPAPVTLAGFSGKYLELTVPASVDLGTCSKVAGASASTPGAFVTWVGPAGDDYNGLAAPGSHDRVWILDVDGVRLVLDATDYASATSDDKAELQSIIDSIRVEPLSAAPGSSSSSPVAGPTGATATDNPASVSSYRIARDDICRREAVVIRGSDDKSGLNAKLDGIFDSALTDAQRAPKIATLTAIGDELDKQHDQLATLEVPSDAPGLAADHAASLADYQRIIDTLTQLRTALVEGRLQDAQALDASSNPISGRIQRFENKYTLFDCG